jgi:hypothetical protein
VASLAAQVIGRKHTAMIGFDNEDDSKKGCGSDRTDNWQSLEIKPLQKGASGFLSY